jgi:hypothetical protein
LKILHAGQDIHALTIEVEGLQGSSSELTVVRNDGALKVRAEGAKLDGDRLLVSFTGAADAENYVAKTITLRW